MLHHAMATDPGYTTRLYTAHASYMTTNIIAVSSIQMYRKGRPCIHNTIGRASSIHWLRIILTHQVNEGEKLPAAPIGLVRGHLYGLVVAQHGQV